MQYEETLKPTYISVDLSEVELAEYDGPLNNSLLLDVSPRIRIRYECSTRIYIRTCFLHDVSFVLQLRHDMIDQKEGETDFAITIHYDDAVSTCIYGMKATKVDA